MKPSELTVDQIADVMDIAIGDLYRIARKPNVLYRSPRTCRTSTGKSREINAPTPRGKRLLRRLLRFWNREFPSHGKAHGGVRGRSCFTSARRHLGRRYIVTRDVRDCYPSVRRDALRRTLRGHGFRADVAWILSGIFTVDDHVPTGSPLSAVALNVYLHAGDQLVSSACGRLGMGYTRVYDDHIVSFDDPSYIDIAAKLTEQAIVKAGLEINQTKRRRHGLQPSSRRQQVHGIVVNHKYDTRLNPSQAAIAVAVARSYVRAARSVSADTIERVAYKRSQVHGWLHHCRQADRSPAREVRQFLDHGDRHVRQVLKKHGLANFAPRWWVTSRRQTPCHVANVWRRKMIAASRGLRPAA